MSAQKAKLLVRTDKLFMSAIGRTASARTSYRKGPPPRWA